VRCTAFQSFRLVSALRSKGGVNAPYGGVSIDMGRMNNILAVHEEDADDIAAAVAFLASDDADFITGADLVVDGAMSSTIAWSRAAHKIRSFDSLKETNT
jgi:NAD(P)-dependent dehydrogenase (short-subunit alcohol dehydrogenase family)